MINYENLKKVNEPFEAEFRSAFHKIIEKGWYVLGEEVQMFEDEFALNVGARNCIGVASGLDAIYLSLKALDLPPESEVLIPSNTYIATIIAVLNAGLVPVLVEPDFATYNMDPQRVQDKISKRSRVLLPVHLYGKLSNMDDLKTIAKKYDLRIVEDCAQAHNAKIRSQHAGTFGDFGAYSFYPTKNLGALGDAGAIVTDDDQMARKIRALRNYGSEKKYYNKYIGINSRLDEMQAAFLRIKLRGLQEITAHKKSLSRYYFDNLSGEIVLPEIQKDYTDVFHIFAIRHDRRDDLKDYLLKKEVRTEIHYPLPPYRQEGFQFLSTESFPISDKIHSTILSLPISYANTLEEIEIVTDVLNNFH